MDQRGNQFGTHGMVSHLNPNLHQTNSPTADRQPTNAPSNKSSTPSPLRHALRRHHTAICGCDSCGLLLKCYKSSLNHCGDSPAHAAEIASARVTMGETAGDAATAVILSWYQIVSNAILKEVKAAGEAARITPT